LKPVIGISSCLLGNRVRYDGKHKRNDFLVSQLTQQFELVAICPEVGIGLGVPREPVQLIAQPGQQPDAVFIHDPSIHITNSLIAYAQQISVDHPNLSGFIFKNRSPSCGLHDTPVFSSSGEKIHSDSGIFAKQVSLIKPLLPVTSEDELQEMENLNAFAKKVTAYTVATKK